MSKRIKIVLLTGLLLSGLSGCRQMDDEPLPVEGQEKLCALGIAALRTSGQNPVSRALTGGTDLPIDGKIGFFVEADADTDANYEATNNLLGVLDAARGLWLPTDSIWLNNKDAKLTVYYPYDGAQTTPQLLNLAPCLRPKDGAKDICFGQFTANNKSPLVELSLKRVYTRLLVTFVKDADADYTGTASLTLFSLKSNSLYADATLSTINGAYTNGAPAVFAPTIPPVTVTGIDPDAPGAARLDLLLLPVTSLTDGLTVNATIDNKAMEVVIPAVGFASALIAGKQYSVTIKLKPTSLTLGNIKTTEWDGQPTFGGGDLEYPEEDIEPVQIGKYTWAGANLRTSDAGESNFEFEKKPWRAGVYPGEVLEDGTVDADKTNLCYWNWGCLNTPIKTPYLPGEAVEWGDTENETLGDPCAKVAPAGTWKVPSKEQFEDLISHLPTNGSSVSINGEKFEVKSETGWAENTKLKVVGQVFVEKDKALFLPAAGGPYNFGMMASVGWNGFYWSRTPHAGDLGEYGYYLYFSSNACNMSYDFRYSVFSVRCVKEPKKP